MCGIAGIFNYRSGEPVDRSSLARITEAMARRGPDGSGEWFSHDLAVGMGHRRLSIQDLSDAGAQPMQSHDGNLVVTFNGEIYNYPELRAELERSGCRFRSSCDTELLLHLYASHGQDMVLKLRGMYAFAIWDQRKQGVFLARDPYGIKPVYYADDGHTFRFASQVKALLTGGHIDTRAEPAGHVGFFLWGYVPCPYTLYRGIRALPSGTTLWLGRNGNRCHRTFCDLKDIFDEGECSSSKSNSQDSDAVPANLRASLKDSVQHHLIGDVPVGVFLSAGTDSATVAALAAEETSLLRTITLGFEEFKGTPRDETPLAERIAHQIGAAHQTLWVTREDFSQERQRLFAAMDQPTTDGVNTFFVSRAAVQLSLKVALSGLGGDELFGGYSSFWQIPRAVRALGAFQRWPGLGERARILTAPWIRRMTSPKYAGLFEYGGSYAGAYLLRRSLFMPWELPSVLDADLAGQGWSDLQPLLELHQTVRDLCNPRVKIACLESCRYLRDQPLRDSDWAGMAHSVEIRVPLADLVLSRALAPLLARPHPPGKRELAAATRFKLPSEVTQRPKTGFGVPIREWLLRNENTSSSQITQQPQKTERGLRAWAKVVYREFTGQGTSTFSHPVAPAWVGHSLLAAGKQVPVSLAPPSKKILVLAGDAFGGFGGMAKFNCDLLNALCQYSSVREVVAFPRVISEPLPALPTRLRYESKAAQGKLRYAVNVFTEILRRPHPDIIICGHLHLLPLAFLCNSLTRSPIVLILHGIEAWKPHRTSLVNRLASRPDFFLAVSEFTKRRFVEWSGAPGERGAILPNCVDLQRFAPGPKSPELLRRYGLQGRTVIMTMGRLACKERYKGFDEILRALPELARAVPNLVYLIAGDGPDRARLEASIRERHFQSRVVFAGRIAEEEKPNLYRLADAYVMPSRGEGFGIVFLEAMGCGVPVVASKADGSREAVRNGELGILVNPDNLDEIVAGTLQALVTNNASATRRPPPGLEYFSYANFELRCHRILSRIFAKPVPVFRALRSSLQNSPFSSHSASRP